MNTKDTVVIKTDAPKDENINKNTPIYKSVVSR